MEYLAKWSIEIEADSPLAAARLARQHQTRRGTTATVFRVEGRHEDDAHIVDLTEGTVEPV